MTKKHHYLPRHYLRGFALPEEPERIWVLDKDDDRSYVTSVENAAAENYYYALPDDDGGQDTDSVEIFLANKIEGPAIEAIEKIREQAQFDKQDKMALVPYLALMHSRVPRYRERVQNALPEVMAKQRERWREFLEEAKKDGRISSDEAATFMALIRQAHNGIETDIPQEFMVPKLYDTVALAIWNMHWVFLVRNRAPYFITSDNPFVFTEGKGLKPPDGQIIFPISKHVVLWALWEARRDRFYQDANEALVAEVDGYILGNATRFVYSSTQPN